MLLLLCLLLNLADVTHCGKIHFCIQKFLILMKSTLLNLNFCVKNEMNNNLIFSPKLFCRSVCGDAIFSSQSKTLLACVFVFVGAHGGSFTIFHSLIG